jgi:hypothetical protein
VNTLALPAGFAGIGSTTPEEAGRAVAGLLWKEAFSAALEPSPWAGESLGGSHASQVYRSLFLEEVAARAAARGAGIRQSIERGLSEARR